MRILPWTLQIAWLPIYWLAVRTAWLHVHIGSDWAWLMVPGALVVIAVVSLASWRLCIPDARGRVAWPVLFVVGILVGAGAAAAEQHGVDGRVGVMPLLLVRDDAPAWDRDDCFAHFGDETPAGYEIYLISDTGDILPMHRRTIHEGLLDAFSRLDVVIHDGPAPTDPTGDASIVEVRLLYAHRIVGDTVLAGQYCASRVQATATSAAATWPTVVHEVGHHFGLPHSHGGFMVDTQQVLTPTVGWTDAQRTHLDRWAVPGTPAPGVMVHDSWRLPPQPVDDVTLNSDVRAVKDVADDIGPIASMPL